MSHHSGLGKEWVDGPGFIRWLEEIRPLEMMRGGTEGSGYAGRSAWASDADVRSLYRAEFESGTLSLAVADRLCVKLDIHIDTEMPADLWVDKVPRGRKVERPESQATKKAKRLFNQGRTPERVSELTGLSLRYCCRLYAERPGHQGLTYVPDEPAYFERAA